MVRVLLAAAQHRKRPRGLISQLVCPSVFMEPECEVFWAFHWQVVKGFI